MGLFELCHENILPENLTDEERETLRDSEWADMLDENRRPDHRIGLALSSYDIRRLPEVMVPAYLGESEVYTRI